MGADENRVLHASTEPFMTVWWSVFGTGGRAGQVGVAAGSPDGHWLRRSEESQTVAPQKLFWSKSITTINVKIFHYKSVTKVQKRHCIVYDSIRFFDVYVTS